MTATHALCRSSYPGQKGYVLFVAVSDGSRTALLFPPDTHPEDVESYTGAVGARLSAAGSSPRTAAELLAALSYNWAMKVDVHGSVSADFDAAMAVAVAAASKLYRLRGNSAALQIVEPRVPEPGIPYTDDTERPARTIPDWARFPSSPPE